MFGSIRPRQRSSSPRGSSTSAHEARPSTLSAWQRMGSAFTPPWSKAGEAAPPRVVQPTEKAKGWTTGGVISTVDLTHYERVRLNAMEDRVLPASARIKIVFAQANAGARESEIEADVKRLDGLVRTLALWSILEHNAIDSSKSDKLSPDRERELGKMLLAAVQLELLQMLDDICEAGDVENDLFDDLCSDTIQDGRRSGFFHLSPALLIAPGSGYKRLLQIRKDQIVEEIAEASGLRTLQGHDCQRELSPSTSPSNGNTIRISGHDTKRTPNIDCGSGESRRGLRLKSGSSTTFAGVADPSPSSQRLESRSPSPVSGHRRTQTQRVRDLLSSIDGLVMESEKAEPEEALVNLPPLSPEAGGAPSGEERSSHGGGRNVNRERHSTGGVGARGDRSTSRISLRTPPAPDGQDDGRSSENKAFFPHENNWRVPYASTPPPELPSRRSSVVPDQDNAADANEVDSSDMLLAEVDWLIAGTNAALGDPSSVAEDDPDASGGGNADKSAEHAEISSPAAFVKARENAEDGLESEGCGERETERIDARPGGNDDQCRNDQAQDAVEPANQEPAETDTPLPGVVDGKTDGSDVLSSGSPDAGSLTDVSLDTASVSEGRPSANADDANDRLSAGQEEAAYRDAGSPVLASAEMHHKPDAKEEARGTVEPKAEGGGPTLNMSPSSQGRAGVVIAVKAAGDDATHVLNAVQIEEAAPPKGEGHAPLNGPDDAAAPEVDEPVSDRDSSGLFARSHTHEDAMQKSSAATLDVLDGYPSTSVTHAPREGNTLEEGDVGDDKDGVVGNGHRTEVVVPHDSKGYTESMHRKIVEDLAHVRPGALDVTGAYDSDADEGEAALSSTMFKGQAHGIETNGHGGKSNHDTVELRLLENVEL